MSSRSVCAPWEYLRQASTPALQSFELSRLNHASNLRKEIDLLLDEWLDETAAALLARFLMDQSKAPEPAARGRTRRSLNVASQSTTPRFLTRGRIG